MEKQIKAVIYARVSSEEQKREGFSIPAQLDLLRPFAKEHNIDVVREFEEAEMAKQAVKQAVREELKKKGENLHEQLDKALGF